MEFICSRLWDPEKRFQWAYGPFPNHWRYLVHKGPWSRERLLFYPVLNNSDLINNTDFMFNRFIIEFINNHSNLFGRWDTLVA